MATKRFASLAVDEIEKKVNADKCKRNNEK